MRRRDVIALTGGAAAWPVLVWGQQSKIWRVGFLGASSAASYAPLVDAFRAGLKERGYVEGRDLALDFRWADGHYDRLPGLAAELCGANPDVIVTHGTPGALAAERATTTIPIVMAIIGDAVAVGVVHNIRSSDRNITGTSFFSPELAAKRVELLKEAMPGIRRVALLSIPENAVMGPTIAVAGQTAGALGIHLGRFEVHGVDEFKAAFAAMVEQQMEAVVIPEDGLTVAHAGHIGELCLAARLPAVGFQGVAKGGGILAYGVDIPETFRHAAYFVDRVFKGAKPAELPIEEARKFILTVNLKAAKVLDLAIPATLLARADEVIE